MTTRIVAAVRSQLDEAAPSWGEWLTVGLVALGLTLALLV